MEKNSISTSGLKNPIQTGTVLDNLSTAFKHTKEILSTHWKFLVIAGLCLSILDLSISAVFNKYNISLLNPPSVDLYKQIYGELIGTFLAKSSAASNLHSYLTISFALLASFRFHRFIRSSETFEQIPKRGFIIWILMSFLNFLVTIIGLYIFLGIFVGIIALIVSLLMIPSLTVLTVIGVIIGIAAGIVFLVLCLMFIGVINQISIFSLFKKVYPIGVLKHSFNSAFSPSGSRKGGFMGLNLWHFVGVTLIDFLVILIFGLIVGILALIVISVLPSTVPMVKYLSRMVFILIYTFIYVITYFFWYTSAAVYVSENLAFGDNNIQEEIITRAGK